MAVAIDNATPSNNDVLSENDVEPTTSTTPVGKVILRKRILDEVLILPIIFYGHRSKKLHRFVLEKNIFTFVK